MGYGDYSYLTDRTSGHVQQYYTHKFQTAQNYGAGGPTAAKLGRDLKGGVFVPIEGIPREVDPALPTSDEPTAPDPRLVEVTGAMYPWDPNYEDPALASSTLENVSDEEVASNAFAKFRSSVYKERGMALTAMDFGAAARVESLKEGFDATHLLTFDGALDVAYARAQKISNPQFDIPGTAGVGSVGAMDLIQSKGGSKRSGRIATWQLEGTEM